MKEFQITYNGAKARILIDDHPPAGTMMKIANMVFKKRPGGTIDFDVSEYMYAMATNLVKEAPWQLASIDALNQLDFKTTFRELCHIIGTEFPLEDFLFPFAELIYGQQFEIPSASQIGSTIASPSSDSRSGKSTRSSRST